MVVVPAHRMTLEEAAARLGVHYMTVYRYVRLGYLPAEQTGGRWYVEVDDLDALDRGQGKGRGVTPKVKWPDQINRLLSTLVAGDGPGSWKIIETALVGSSAADVQLGLLAPTMGVVGDKWEDGTFSIADEHRATALALGILGRLAPHFARRGRRRPGTVVLAGAAGDNHAMPLMMVANLLRGDGWSVVDLGADVPVESVLEETGRAPNLMAVGLSLSTDCHGPGLAAAAAAVKDAHPGVPVIAGGPAVPTAEVARQLGADEWAPDAASASALLASLASLAGTT